MRTGHGRALQIAVFPARQCAVDSAFHKLHVSARRTDIHPFAVVRVICRLTIRPNGCHGEHPVVLCRPCKALTVIARRENHQTAGHRTDLLAVLHSGFVNEIVDRVLVG